MTTKENGKQTKGTNVLRNLIESNRFLADMYRVTNFEKLKRSNRRFIRLLKIGVKQAKVIAA